MALEAGRWYRFEVDTRDASAPTPQILHRFKRPAAIPRGLRTGWIEVIMATDERARVRLVTGESLALGWSENTSPVREFPVAELAKVTLDPMPIGFQPANYIGGVRL